MLVGKRPRPQMRRTTSMTGMTTDAEATGSDPHHAQVLGSAAAGDRDGGCDERNKKGVVLETSHFLRICCFCKRRLAPGRDIYMYKGDTAFCSEECREQQMEHDAPRTRNGVVSSFTESN